MPHRLLKTVAAVILFFCTFSAAAQAKASLNHIALTVHNLGKSTAFYKNIIGLDTIPEPFHDGKHTWFQIGPLSHLHLIEDPKTVNAPYKGTHLCFTVPSVLDFIERLKKAKVPYEDWAGKPNAFTLRVDGVKQIYFQDPEGYWIEINDAKQ